MHIVIDARFLRQAAGGIGRYVRALLRELNTLKNDHHYTVLLTPEDQTDWLELVQRAGLAEPRWQSKIIDIANYSYAEQTTFPRLLRSLKPDLVHFTNFNHPLLWSSPFIVTIHDLTILNYPVGRRQKSVIAQLAFGATLKHAVRAAKKVITVSEVSKKDILTQIGGESEAISVTYEGVDDHYQPVNFPQRGRNQVLLTQKYGIRAPYLLFVSQWRPHKGIDTLVKSYETLRSRQKRYQPQLVITGQPNPNFPEIPALIERSRFAPDIIRPGFIDEADLPRLYQGAEAFIFPSRYEGFGLTPLEAMASGTPVIASNTSCLPEILGEAAVLVDPDQPVAWADAIESLLGNRSLWTKYRTAGLARARDFSWKKMAQETLDLYEAALA